MSCSQKEILQSGMFMFFVYFFPRFPQRYRWLNTSSKFKEQRFVLDIIYWGWVDNRNKFSSMTSTWLIILLWGGITWNARNKKKEKENIRYIIVALLTSKSLNCSRKWNVKMIPQCIPKTHTQTRTTFVLFCFHWHVIVVVCYSSPLLFFFLLSIIKHFISQLACWL